MFQPGKIGTYHFRHLVLSLSPRFGLPLSHNALVHRKDRKQKLGRKRMLVPRPESNTKASLARYHCRRF